VESVEEFYTDCDGKKKTRERYVRPNSKASGLFWETRLREPTRGEGMHKWGRGINAKRILEEEGWRKSDEKKGCRKLRDKSAGSHAYALRERNVKAGSRRRGGCSLRGGDPGRSLHNREGREGKKSLTG